MKKRLIATFVVLVLTFIGFLPQASANALQNYVERTIGTANTSFTIESARTGQRIFHINGDVARQPASNLKLVTGFGALYMLGGDYRFKTEVYASGPIENGVLKGHLFLKGYGDPTLQYQDLQSIAQALKAQGIHKIEGHILGDDSYFSGPQLSPGVEPYEESEYYAARVSALAMSPNADYDAGTIIMEVKPSQVGYKPLVYQLPGYSNLTIINNSVTSRKGTRNTISIKRKTGTNEVVISGQIPMGSSVKEWVTVADPTVTTLFYARSAIQQAGIQLGQGSWFWRQSVIPQDNLIYTHYSIPLGSMYPTFMKLSNNVMGDMFLKTIGAERKGVGDFANGAAALNEYLQASYMPMSKMVMVDGSGLSNQNRLTTNELTSFLNKTRKTYAFQSFYSGLPVGGVSDRLIGGTLKNRFQGNYKYQVVAKTGYITGVYTLSGYVKTRNGNEYVISIMTEHNKNSKIGQIDQVVKHIIDYY